MKINTRVLLKRMERAIALHCTVENQRHAAATFNRSGRLLAIGVNRRDDSPAYGYSRHAEYDALFKTYREDKPFAILVSRLTPLGWALSRPCWDCIQGIKLTGIKKMYYTTGGANGGIECENL